MRRPFQTLAALFLPIIVSLSAAGERLDQHRPEPRARVAAAHPARRPLARPQLIGSWGAWRAATHQAAGSVVCYAYTRTASSVPSLRGRGDVVLTVTERPGAPRDAVALSAGFVYPPGSAVEMVAGNARLAFYTAQRSAFARDSEATTRAFQAAGDNGRTAAARSPAPHGRSVTDTFSLDGFAHAHAAIEEACPLHA